MRRLLPRGSALVRVVVASALVVSGFVSRASAAGLEVPENGALPLARGGTAVSLGGTAYALQFNPAGLSDVEGLDVRLDARLVSHEVSFLRAPRGDDTFAAVSNSAGAFLGPSATIAYRFGGGLRPLAVGLGVWGPPGVGRYQYPDPQAIYADGNGEPPLETGLLTGQRYGVITSATRVLLPSVGASWKFTDALSVGLTFSSALSLITMKQAIAAKSAGGSESVTADAIATLDLVDTFSPAGMLGVQWAPVPGLRIGGTFRPAVDIEAAGTLKIETLLGGDNIRVEGDRARLKLTLPPMARFGATYEWSDFSVSSEIVYEGWSANRRFVLTPEDITLTISGETTTLKEMTIEKGWRDSAGVRLGGSWRAIRGENGAFGLTLHAGLLAETNAIPEARQNIDAVTGDRAGGSLGVTASLGGFALTAAVMGYLPVTMVVDDSEVVRPVADAPDNPPIHVGNGTYTSNIVIGSVGVAWTGLGQAQ